MTKPVTRKMAVDNLLWLIQQPGGTMTLPGTMPDLPEGTLVFRCYICGEPILPGQVVQFDHVHAVIHGGAHHHEALKPVHYDPCHKGKTKRDTQAQAKGDRILGLTCNGPKRRIPSKPFTRAKRPFPKRIKP